MACGPCNRGDHAGCLGRDRWCDCDCDPPEPVAYKPILRVKCWCGLWVTVVESSRGPALLHAPPACQRFLDEPITEFLHNLRVHYEQ